MWINFLLMPFVMPFLPLILLYLAVKELVGFIKFGVLMWNAIY